MEQTYWVTFSDPKIEPQCTIFVRKQDPKLPRTFGVQVDHGDNSVWTQICSRAILLAKREYEAWISAQTLPLAPEPVEPQPVSVVEPLKPVFSIEDVEPFIDDMLSRMLAVAGSGLRLELMDVGTASTDCVHYVQFNPEPFLLGHIEAGLGRGLHEVGHIRYDQRGTRRDRKRKQGEQAFGTALLACAREEGGASLVHILNLVMDRRADDRQAKEFPGNANALYRRLGFLLPGERVLASGETVKRLNGVLLDCKTSVLTDFAYAIKKRTRPKQAIVRRCVNLARRAIRRVNRHERRYAHLLSVSKLILELLRMHMSEEEKKEERQIEKAEKKFDAFMQTLAKAIYSKSDAETGTRFRKLMIGKLAKRRQATLLTFSKKLAHLPPRGPSAGAGGDEEKGILPVGRNPAAYQAVLGKVLREARIVREILRRLSIQEIEVLHGLSRGELDLDELPRFITGGSDCMKIDLHKYKLDLAIAFLLDASGSMGGYKAALELAVAFNEGLLPFRHTVDSHFFAFNDFVFDCGAAQPNNGVAGVPCAGGTLEAFGVRVAGNWLRGSRRRRKLLVTVCDGAPADVKKTKEQVDALVAAGILPMRILVGVDIAPKTYPIELFFDSWPEFSRELGRFFETVIRAARVV